MTLPYPKSFTIEEGITESDSIKMKSNDPRIKELEEQGYKLISTERPHQDRPGDIIFNPTLFIYEKSGGERYVYSPELVEIWDRFIGAMHIATPPPRRTSHKAWINHIQGNLTSWFWNNAPSLEEIGAGGRTPSEWVSELAAEIDRTSASYLQLSLVPPALARVKRVLLNRLSTKEAEREDD